MTSRGSTELPWRRLETSRVNHLKKGRPWEGTLEVGGTRGRGRGKRVEFSGGPRWT